MNSFFNSEVYFLNSQVLLDSQLMKNIYISVTNDLVTDQRVYRTIKSLLKSDSKITLIGRKLKHSGEMNPKLYHVKRFRLIFNKGLLFYAEFNIRLFLC